MFYSEQVLHYFNDMQYVGEFGVDEGAVSCTQGSREQGDFCQLQFTHQTGNVTQARFKVLGTPALTAVLAYVCEKSTGLALTELAATFTPDNLIEALGLSSVQEGAAMRVQGLLQTIHPSAEEVSDV